MVAGQDDQVQVLQKIVHELREEVAELKNQNNDILGYPAASRMKSAQWCVHDVLC